MEEPKSYPWKCPVCGFEAHGREEWAKHMEDTKDDPDHVRYMEEHGHDAHEMPEEKAA